MQVFQSLHEIQILLLTIEIDNCKTLENTCNPQMVHCVVCHLIRLEHDAKILNQRKHKGLVNYNKNHNISALKKYVFHEQAI
jgi:hypothetical protein